MEFILECNVAINPIQADGPIVGRSLYPAMKSSSNRSLMTLKLFFGFGQLLRLWFGCGLSVQMVSTDVVEKPGMWLQVAWTSSVSRVSISSAECMLEIIMSFSCTLFKNKYWQRFIWGLCPINHVRYQYVSLTQRHQCLQCTLLSESTDAMFCYHVNVTTGSKTFKVFLKKDSELGLIGQLNSCQLFKLVLITTTYLGESPCFTYTAKAKSQGRPCLLKKLDRNFMCRLVDRG